MTRGQGEEHDGLHGEGRESDCDGHLEPHADDLYDEHQSERPQRGAGELPAEEAPPEP